MRVWCGKLIMRAEAIADEEVGGRVAIHEVWGPNQEGRARTYRRGADTPPVQEVRICLESRHSIGGQNAPRLLEVPQQVQRRVKLDWWE